MRYEVLKRVTRNFEEKFSKEKQTNEIHININGFDIFITEQQCGHLISEPHVTIFVPNGYSYGMDFNTFIKKLTD